MCEFLNWLGHLPQDIEAESQIRLWVNALVWELDINLAALVIGERPRDARGMAVFNYLENRSFDRFFRTANKVNSVYLKRAIKEEIRAKAINDKLWAE